MAAAIVIPPSLLPADSNEYAESQEQARSVFRPEIGSTRHRRMFVTTPRIFEVSWDLALVPYATLKTWFENSTNRGEREFDIPLIDTVDNQLMWFTVNWITPFRSVCYNGLRWKVYATVRSIKEPFLERDPGTDELYGSNDVVFNNVGYLEVAVGLYGASAIEFTNVGRMAEGALFGSSAIEFNNSAMFAQFGVLYGDEDVVFDNTGTLLTADRRITNSGVRVINTGEWRKVN